MVYKFFDKKSAGSGFKKLKNMAEPSALARSSSILADERHKPIIRKFNKRKVYSQFKDNILEGGVGGRFSGHAIIK